MRNPGGTGHRAADPGHDLGISIGRAVRVVRRSGHGQRIQRVDISAAGLMAQRTRLNVVAENLANAETTRTATATLPTQARRFGAGPLAPFSQALTAAQATSVKVLDIEESQEPLRMIHQPPIPTPMPKGS